MSFNHVAIVTVRRNYHRIHSWGITKSEAVNRTKNADLGEKGGQLIMNKEIK